MIGRELVGRFRILAKLGEGGMGAVYRGEQISLKRACAIKVLRPELTANQQLLTRFKSEAQVIAKLDHPNTVKVYDYGQDTDGSLFIAMELVEGQALRNVLVAAGPLNPARAFTIALQVAASLVDAHANSIVHRDLKPDNVMLVDKGRQRDLVRVLDFGIAKLRDESRSTQQAMTQAGDMLGTPQYMAPEQIKGEAIDGRTDIYALGCMIYEMVTARLPFEAPTIMAMLSKHLVEMPPPPSQRRPDLNLAPAIDHVVMIALQKDPNARPANMEQYAEQLAAVLAQLPPDPARAQQGQSGGQTAPIMQPTPPPQSYATPQAVSLQGVMPGGAPVGAIPTPGSFVAPYSPQPQQAQVQQPYSPQPPPQTFAPPTSPPRSNLALYLVIGALALGGAGVAVWAATHGKKTETKPTDEPPKPDPTEKPDPPDKPDPPEKPDPKQPDPWGGSGTAPTAPTGPDPWATPAAVTQAKAMPSALPDDSDVGTNLTPIPARVHLNPPAGFQRVPNAAGWQLYASRAGVVMMLAPLEAGTNDPNELAQAWIDENPDMGLTLSGIKQANGRPVASFTGTFNGTVIVQFAMVFITSQYRFAYIVQAPATSDADMLSKLLVTGVTVP